MPQFRIPEYYYGKRYKPQTRSQGDKTMTRLATADVKSIPAELANYDSELTAKTGCSLRKVACQAADIQEDLIQQFLESVRIGVIPITTGKGAITGFCEAVAGINSHMGCKSFITQAADVAGLIEAFGKKADIIMLADDHRFIALHAASRQVVENAVATGKGFVTGLGLMAGDLNKKNVLVIGCGPVGRSASAKLAAMGARVSVYDINSARCIDLSEATKQSSNVTIQVIKDLDRALKSHHLIIDASPAADIIQARHITPDTYICAPGVPVGLDHEARLKIGNRLLHDPLQIGVATMAISAFKFHIQRT
jgi:pyrrolysine biosynthesis protein PylD